MYLMLAEFPPPPIVWIQLMNSPKIRDQSLRHPESWESTVHKLSHVSKNIPVFIVEMPPDILT